MVLSDVKGNQGMSNAMLTVADAPQGLVSLTTAMAVPFSNIFRNVAGSTLPTLVRDVNATLLSHTDVRKIARDARCVADHIDNLPSMQVVEDFLDTTDTALAFVRTNVTAIDGALDGLAATKDVITGNITALDTTFTALQPQLTAVTDSATALEAAVVPVTDTQTALVAPTTGLVPLLQADFNTLDADFPSSTDVTDAADSIASLTSGALDGPGNEAGRTTLQTRLTALRDTLQDTLPDGNTIATNMAAFNTALDDMVAADSITTFNDAVTAAETAVAALPDVADVKAAVTALETAVAELTLAGVRTPLAAIDATITGMPRFSILITELDKIRPIVGVLPCMRSATDELLGLNNSVVRLPNSVLELTELYDDLNVTLNDALTVLDDFDTQLTSAQADVDAATTTQYVADLDQMQLDLDTAKADLDFTSIHANLDAVGTDAAAVDFSVAADIRAFNDTLVSARVDASAITAAQSYETARSGLVTGLNAAVADVGVYVQGYCSADVAATCGADGDCGAGTCDGIGTRRCQNVQSTTCTADADCGGGDRCLIDSDTFNTLSTTLQAFTKPTFTDTTAAMSAVASAGSFSAAGMSSTVAAAKASVANVDVTAYQASLTDMRASVDLFDVTSVDSALTDVSAAIDGTDFTSMRSEVASVRTEVDDLQGDTRKDIQDGVNATEALVEFLYDGVLAGYLDRLAPDALAAAQAERGIMGMVLVATGVADDVSAFWANRTTLLGSPLTLSRDVQEEEDIVRYLDIVSTDDYSQHGPLYFIGALMDVKMVPHNHYNSQGVFKDSRGVKYTDDRVCLTRACVEFTLMDVNQRDMQSVTEGFLPVQLSREALQRTFMVFPAIIVLLGIAAMLSCLCCQGSPRTQKCPASCFTACIFLQLPLMFLVSGLLFTLVMVTGDACYGAANVGFQYIATYGDQACGDLLGGDGTLAACTVSTTLNSRAVNATLNLPDVYSGLLGACPASGDPLAPVYASVRDEVHTVPSEELEDFLADNEGTDIEFKDPLKANLRTAAADLGAHSAAFVDDMSDTANCAAINGAVMGFKEALCCDVTNALYWSIAAWYAMAWLMCLCGWQTGLFARKRLTTRLWGPSYTDDLMDATLIGDVAVTKPANPVRTYPEQHGSVASQPAINEYDAYPAYQDDPDRPPSRQAW